MKRRYEKYTKASKNKLEYSELTLERVREIISELWNKEAAKPGSWVNQFEQMTDAQKQEVDKVFKEKFCKK